MNRPAIPIMLMLITLIGVWLGIFGPLPAGIAGWLQNWQTLIAATVASTLASIAAYIAFQNTSRSLAHTESLEANRRRRKHAAVRAVLPLALSQVVAYAERSARALNSLVDACKDEALPAGVVGEDLLEPLPSETLRALADFIEYTDGTTVEVLESTVAWIQILDARMRSIVQDNNDPSGSRVVVRAEIEGRIIDAATIYAGASSAFNYARRRHDRLPGELSWDSVFAALRNMRFWDDEHPRLYQFIERQQSHSAGPFERLRVGPA